MLLTQIVRVPDDGVDAFRRFEDAVLPLLPAYGARLERRLRSVDGRTEIHVLYFPSADALARYRVDPVRSAHLELLAASRAEAELLEVIDVA